MTEGNVGMKLYTHPFSQHCRRVLMLCGELGVEPELALVSLETGEHKSAEFLKLNPAGQVPVLENEGLVLPESHAIMKYLAARHGAGEWYPAEPAARADVDRWLDWTHTQLNPPIQAIAIHARMGGADSEAGVARSGEKAIEALDILETGLGSKNGIGGTPTLADLAVASTLALYQMCGGELERFPGIAAWFEKFKQRPSFLQTAPVTG